MGAPSGNNCIFDTIAIVGVGLIGGSIGMAAKRSGLAKRVIGIGRSESKLMKAKILNAIDDYSLDTVTGAADADLVVVCTPVRTVVSTIEQMSASLKDGAIITDVGSTKGWIVSEASKVVPERCCFVGGHPMAGSEQTGVDAAYPDLFLSATYVLTATDETDLGALGKMTEFAEALGANVHVMSPDQHDSAAAIISHLPHAMAAALLQLAEDSQRKDGKVFALAAGSFRDLTRISDSSPEIWRDICTTNSRSLVEAIEGFKAQLDEFKQVLMAGDEDEVMRFFENAVQIRQTYLRISK